MSIQIIAQGTLLAKPESVESDGEEVAAVMFGTRQEVFHEGRAIELSAVPTAELVCTGQCAPELLQLRRGDRVAITGTMTVACRLSDVEDRFAKGRVSFRVESLTRLG